MSQTNPDSPPANEEGAGPPGLPKSGTTPLPQNKPLPEFRAKPKSLGDVTDRLVTNRHGDGRGPGWWKRYGPWIAVGQLTALVAVGVYLLVTAGAVYQFLLVLAVSAALAFVRWLIFSYPE